MKQEMTSIKVRTATHQQLRTMAARYNARLWAVVDMAVVALISAEKQAKTTARNGRKERGK